MAQQPTHDGAWDACPTGDFLSPLDRQLHAFRASSIYARNGLFADAAARPLMRAAVFRGRA